MTIAEALDGVRTEEQDFASLLDALHVRRYTGVVLLHCVEGQPKVVELPAVQVRLHARPLTTPRASRTLSQNT